MVKDNDGLEEMNQALQEEDDDIVEIKRTLEEAGVTDFNPDDELNINLAEYDGWPPTKI